MKEKAYWKCSSTLPNPLLGKWLYPPLIQRHKDHPTNLPLHPLVENPSSFSGSSIRSEKGNSIVFQEIRAKRWAKQIISPIISPNKKIPATKADRSTAQTKFQMNNNSNNNNKVILHNRTEKKNHQMMQ